MNGLTSLIILIGFAKTSSEMSEMCTIHKRDVEYVLNETNCYSSECRVFIDACASKTSMEANKNASMPCDSNSEVSVMSLLSRMRQTCSTLMKQNSLHPMFCASYEGIYHWASLQCSIQYDDCDKICTFFMPPT